MTLETIRQSAGRPRPPIIQPIDLPGDPTTPPKRSRRQASAEPSPEAPSEPVETPCLDEPSWRDDDLLDPIVPLRHPERDSILGDPDTEPV